jgi:PAS domain S-box-containing protein
MMQKPQQRMEQAQAQVGTLREQFDTLARTVEQHRCSLERLHGAMQAQQSPTAQEKILREAMAHLLHLSAQEQHIDQAIHAVELPVSKLVSDFSAQLKEHRRLSALAKSAEVINSTLDLSEVLNQVMDMFIGLSGSERGFLMLLEEKTRTMDFKVARNLDRETIAGTSFEISRTVVEAVVRDAEPIITTNAQADPRFCSQDSVVSYALRSILCVPLMVKGKVTGVIYADNRVKTGLFGASDRDLLVAFANQAAAAIDNARLFESVVVGRNLMQNVFESMTAGVLTIDEDGHFTLFNRAAETILNLRAKRASKEACAEVSGILGPTFSALVDDVRQRRQPITGQDISLSLAPRGQSTLRVSLAPLKDVSDATPGVAVVIDDVTDKARLERERALVKRYLPPELLETLADLKELRLGGARQEVSVLIADIRGFTSYSERHDPDQVVEAINTYFGLIYGVIRANNGIVDKYLGDAVMAHFNSPLLPQPDHAYFAARTACQARQVIEEFQATHPGAVTMAFGIGVNSGEAVAGNIGASDRMEYTLIGDAINLAKRLQESAKPGQILLGPRTVQLARQRLTVRSLRSFQFKGRLGREKVFALEYVND